MKWLRGLHLYSGLVLGLILLVLSLTGGALLFKEEIWRLQYPALSASPAPLTPGDHAVAFQAIASMFPGAVRHIRTPQHGVSAYHVFLDDGEALVGQIDHQLIDRWRWYQTPSGLLIELHTRLATGDAGWTIAGITALATAMMVLSGLVLWWPTRGSFRMGHLRLRSMARPPLLRMHRDLGVIVSPLVLLFTLTAAGIVFYPTARGLLNGLFSDRPPLAAKLSVPGPHTPAMPTGAILIAAGDALPEAELVSYYPPAVGSGVHYFRFRMPGEIHPNGRSAVYVGHESGQVLLKIDATRQPLGERMAHSLYPLHAAKLNSPIYTLLGLLAAISLSILSITGPLAYLTKKRPRGG